MIIGRDSHPTMSQSELGMFASVRMYYLPLSTQTFQEFLFMWNESSLVYWHKKLNLVCVIKNQKLASDYFDHLICNDSHQNGKINIADETSAKSNDFLIP